MKDYEFLVKPDLVKQTKHDFIKLLPERVLQILWVEFSNIQSANFLCIDGGGLAAPYLDLMNGLYLEMIMMLGLNS
jgi:hypothetical protein